MLKKVLSAILVIVMTVTLLVSCADEPAIEQPIVVNLTAEGLAGYVIAYDAENAAVKAAAEKVRDAVSTALSLTLEVKENGAVGEEKKVIAITTAESVSLPGMKEYLRLKDYAVAVYNEKVTLAAGSDAMLDSMADYFISMLAPSETPVTLGNSITVVEGAYPKGYVSIDGVDIERYDIVYPDGCDLLTYYTAVALSDYLADVYDIKVDVKSDKETETVYEILVGYTNRILDVDALVELGENQYVLCKDEAKVVMLGNSYMIAGGASALINKYMASVSAGNDVDITTLPKTAQVETFEWLAPKSVIFMIGDGMGFQHVESAKELRDMPVFFAEEFPYSIKVKTFSYSVDPLREADATDSAAAATALATGYKTINYTVGLDKDGNVLQNIRELAHSKGAKTGVLTTDSITGATPSGFLGHASERYAGDVLQEQIDTLLANGEVEYAVGEYDSDALPELTREAIATVCNGTDPYFIMIEEACIDKHSHNQNLSVVPDRVVRFNKSIAYCTVYTVMNPDSILIVTADHETGQLKKVNGIWNLNKSYHTNSVVPLYALGYDGLTELIGTKRDIDNTSIPKYLARVLYGVEDFGDQEFGK